MYWRTSRAFRGGASRRTGWTVAGFSPHLATSTNLQGAISPVAVEEVQVLIGLAVSSMNLAQLEPEIRTHYAGRAAEQLARDSELS